MVNKNLALGFSTSIFIPSDDAPNPTTVSEIPYKPIGW